MSALLKAPRKRTHLVRDSEYGGRTFLSCIEPGQSAEDFAGIGTVQDRRNSPRDRFDRLAGEFDEAPVQLLALEGLQRAVVLEVTFETLEVGGLHPDA